MKHLAALRPYFARYRGRLLLGLLFVTAANLFAVLSPAVVRQVLDRVQLESGSFRLLAGSPAEAEGRSFIMSLVLWNGLLLVGLALLSGIFLFLMRQTLVVMSRHIEYEQKRDIYAHYGRLDTHFYKTHSTGDLMNRISEDVSRVRMYTGPAIMYATNLIVRASLCIWGMLRVDAALTGLVVLPLPILVATVYWVNKIIYRKSEKIQEALSDLTTTAQEAYSGIRVVRSFVQEEAIARHFEEGAARYRKAAVGLALTESVWFPSMTFFIGLSLLFTVLAGGYLAIRGDVTPGHIAEFVIYLNLLTFPISSLGWVASMIQRAAASQARINEFLHTAPVVASPAAPLSVDALRGAVEFDAVTFTYAHTGVTALKDFSLRIEPGEKVAVIGRTGSGKSTLSHLLLRMYDPTAGAVRVDGEPVSRYDLQALRAAIAYAPQEAILFSDTVYNNIRFGVPDALHADVLAAAQAADLEKDILSLPGGYDTVIGERGVMLSGGQKQRLVLARALLKQSSILLMDESLSAVDTQTEQTILGNLRERLRNTTVIVITHRLFTSWKFDKIVMLEEGRVVESGTHEALMVREGRYAKLYRHQTSEVQTGAAV